MNGFLHSTHFEDSQIIKVRMNNAMQLIEINEGSIGSFGVITRLSVSFMKIWEYPYLSKQFGTNTN